MAGTRRGLKGVLQVVLVLDGAPQSPRCSSANVHLPPALTGLTANHRRKKRMVACGGLEKAQMHLMQPHKQPDKCHLQLSKSIMALPRSTAG